METQFQLQPRPATTVAARNPSPCHITSAARPLLMPAATHPSPGRGGGSGRTAANSHQHGSNSRGTIPAYFPETFKDFFSMLTEDEDHGEVITNLLEDKVIPRSPKYSGRGAAARKPCDKPFCCHNNGGAPCGTGNQGAFLDSPAYCGGGLTRTLSSKYYRRRPSQHRLLGTGDATSLLDSTVVGSTSAATAAAAGTSVTSLNNNVGRSNSFRLNRPAASAASTYSSYLSYQPVDRKATHNLGQCQHIKFCCLHQRDGGEGAGKLSQQSFQNNNSTLSLNERVSTGRLLPSPGVLTSGGGMGGAGGGGNPLSVQYQRIHQQHHHQHHTTTQDGINFSDDEKKSLIYPQQLTVNSPSSAAERYSNMNASGDQSASQDNSEDTFQQHKLRYSLLTKSYDQINRSRIFEPPTSKSRRSSCDTPDSQHPHLYDGRTSTSGTEQTTVTSSISTASAGEGDDDFDAPSTIKYKLIANVANSTSATAQRTAGGGPGGKGQMNIITNPLVRQYPFETSYKTKKMYANETIVTHQPGGNLKTISYGPSAAGVDLKKSPLVNRRRSSSVTLPQPPISNDMRYIKGDSLYENNNSGQQDCRNSRDRYQLNKSGVHNTMASSGVNEVPSSQQNANQKQSSIAKQQTKANNQQQQQQRFGKQRQRMRTASMPAENRKPRLAEMRRSAIHCADVDIEYYRLRSFSITSHGICNLGDSMRSRRSRSINSVTSTGTSNSGRDRNNSNASQTLNELNDAEAASKEASSGIPAYKVAMLGSSGVGKTALTYQFTTSEYICAYDLSLDDDYGQKTVSVLLNGQETDLEVVDHPACEMSTEAFCATYSIDIFVVVYSIVDRKSFKAAERVLQYLRDNDCLLTRGAILVGNKTDLERQREVTVQLGKKLAKEINCKFIETSSGLDHNVDELLVGIVAQVKLNPQRISRLSEKQRILCQQQTGIHLGPNKFKVAAALDSGDESAAAGGGGGASKNGKLTRKRQGGHSTGPLNSLDLHSLKHSVKTNRDKKKPSTTTSQKKTSPHRNPSRSTEDLKEEDEDNKSTSTTSSSSHSLSSSPSIKSSRSTGSLDREMTNFKSRVGGSASCSANSTPIKRASHRHRRAATDGEMYAISREDEESATTSSPAKSGSKTAKSSPIKFTNRTKSFLTSFLKFKKSLRMRRRSSSSCSDLFVI